MKWSCLIRLCDWSKERVEKTFMSRVYVYVYVYGHIHMCIYIYIYMLKEICSRYVCM